MEVISHEKTILLTPGGATDKFTRAGPHCCALKSQTGHCNGLYLSLFIRERGVMTKAFFLLTG